MDAARLSEVRQAVADLQTWAASTPSWKPASVTQPALARMASAMTALLADRDRLAQELDTMRASTARSTKRGKR